MPPQTRATLKQYFDTGSMPTQRDFADLVDSTLNMRDEGFEKTPAEGFKVSQLSDSGKLISFFRYDLGGQALYFIQVDKDQNLVIGSDHTDDSQQRNILFGVKDTGADKRLRIGINTDRPERELDVGGVIRAEGRIGVATSVNKQELKVPADGVWHSITDILGGCHAFEVMAGVGGQKTLGRYSLTHAIALNAYNPKGPLFNFLNFKKRIKYHTTYYRSRNDKLRLRWLDEGNHNYRLQLKSSTNIGEGIEIKYYLTSLWFDEEMSESRPPEESSGG